MRPVAIVIEFHNNRLSLNVRKFIFVFGELSRKTTFERNKLLIVRTALERCNVSNFIQ